jgi:hypothetical protein
VSSLVSLLDKDGSVKVVLVGLGLHVPLLSLLASNQAATVCTTLIYPSFFP